MAKALVAAAVVNSGSHGIKEYLSALSKLQGAFDVLLVNYSKARNYAEWLSKKQDYLKIKVMHQEFSGSETVAEKRAVCHNAIREYALEKKYTHLLMLEQDVVIPPDGLKKLLKAKKGVVSGISYQASVFSGNLLKTPAVWSDYTKEEQADLKKNKETLKRVNPRLFEALEKGKWDFSGMKHPFSPKDVSGKEEKLLPIHSSLFDCLLISKKALEGMKFSTGHGKRHDETQFFLDLKEKKIQPYALTSVQCTRKMPAEFVQFLKNVAQHQRTAMGKTQQPAKAQ